MRRGFRWAGWVGLLLTLVQALPARAQCERPYQVGVSPLGWAVFERERRLQGIVPDLMQALEARSGCTLVLALRPRARVLLEFSAGQLDLITSSLPTPERDAVGQFVPYAFTELDLVVRDSVPRHVDTATKLLSQDGLNLGLVRGVHQGPGLAPVIARLSELGRVELASDFENLAVRLNAGRFDAAIYPSAIHTKQIHDGLLDARVRVIDIPESEPLAIGVYLQRQSISEADRRRLETALRQIVQDGVVEAIYRKYLSADEVRRLFKTR